MQRLLLFTLGVATSFIISFYGKFDTQVHQDESQKIIHMDNNEKTTLGAFSLSLSVKDINVSKEFYEHLGFTVFGGSLKNRYLIMKNGSTLIGLFQRMFENNILTFNPGWDENAKNLENFVDIRQMQQNFKSKGIDVGTEIDVNSSGPASFTLTDPDGNLILFDQHRL